MKAILLLLQRSLLPTGGQMLSFVLWISISGVVLGIVQLIVVLAVMSGFQKFLQQTYTRISSEIVVIPRGDNEIAIKELLDVNGVAAASPFQWGQAMLSKDGAAGVVLEGIDETTTTSVTPWDEVWVDSPDVFPDPKKDWVWLGVQLAEKLGVGKGDTVNLFVPGQNEVHPLRVTAVTKFGLYQHDLRYAQVNLSELSRLMGMKLGAPMVKVKVADGFEIEAVQSSLIDALGGKIRTRLWSELDTNFLRAVQHQKLSLFAILEIVIGLAAMNVVNLLMMSGQHRKRDIAILRAMGLRRHSLFSFFVAQGAAVGSVGILSGIGLGLIACELIKVFQPTFLSEKVYNVTRLPLKVEWGDLAMIAGGALTICLIFSVLPAIRAARMNPIEALRYE